MAGRDAMEVNARVVYWGIEGCGKSSNLRAVYARLRPDHRSEIRQQPTRFDPTVSYEILPIELGEIAGVRTRLQIVAAPSDPDQAPTRKQLLDQVDGVVLVLDCQPERIDENLASYEELRQALAAYGRRLDSIPLVVQYNKRDLGDPYAIESLHRKLALGSAPVFEAVASEGSGVLQTLSTISKRVIRSLRDREPAPAPPAEAPAPRPVEPPARPAPPPPRPEPALPQPLVRPEPEAPAFESSAARMEQAILDEEAQAGEAGATAEQVEADLEPLSWEPVVGELEAPDAEPLEIGIVSVGEARRTGRRRVRLPLVLGDASGQTLRVAVTIEIEPLLDEDP